MGGRLLTYERIASGFTDMVSDMSPDVGSNPRTVNGAIKGWEGVGVLVRQGKWLVVVR
jgi:hypothetical protein